MNLYAIIFLFYSFQAKMEPNVFSEIYLPLPPSSSIYLLLRKTTTCEKKLEQKSSKFEDP